MEIEVLATLLGVALAALVAACGAGFRWLRSDFRDLRSHVDTRFQERTEATNAQFTSVDTRFERLETRFDTRFDRLEAKVDDLIMGLVRGGFLTDPRLPAPRPSSLEPESAPVAQPPEPAPAPTEAPAETALPSEPPSEISDPARGPPAIGAPPTAEQPSGPPPAEAAGPTAQPA